MQDSEKAVPRNITYSSDAGKAAAEAAVKAEGGVDAAAAAPIAAAGGGNYEWDDNDKMIYDLLKMQSENYAAHNEAQARSIDAFIKLMKQMREDRAQRP